MNPPPFKLAFSLVELSIVLVILGLLVGGVLSGQSLIRAAELRATTAQVSKFRSAIFVFRDKYFALPGDMPNAVRFWGTKASSLADGYDAACDAITTGAVGTETCNGNGDGFMASATVADNPTQYHERAHAWQHLSNAGLIEGKYTGEYNREPFAPFTKVDSQARFTLIRHAEVTTSGNTNYFISPLGNMMHIGRISPSTSTLGPFIRPEDAWNIDTKLDDGKTDTGFILGMKGTGTIAPNCTVLNGSIWEYNFADSSASCNLQIRMGH